MCSIFKYKNTIGRNFDYEQSYKETIKTIPKTSNPFTQKYDIIGMATGLTEYPLLYDGMNSAGLVVGGLAFTGNAKYIHSNANDKFHIPSYDFTLRILSECGTVQEAKELLDYVVITDVTYEEFPSSDLHWFIADNEESIIVEQTETGLNYYSGDVMTNNPPYNQQNIIGNFYNARVGNTDFNPNDYPNYQTRGSETVGLQGDYTSEGRFARLSFLKEKLEQTQNTFNPISQAFHLLASVEQVYGATPVKQKYEYTIYSITYDMKNLKAYIKSYDNLQVKEVTL